MKEKAPKRVQAPKRVLYCGSENLLITGNGKQTL